MCPQVAEFRRVLRASALTCQPGAGSPRALVGRLKEEVETGRCHRRRLHDMQGRLMGSGSMRSCYCERWRTSIRSRLQLPARARHGDGPDPGYEIASWERGYGTALRPDRDAAPDPWLGQPGRPLSVLWNAAPCAVAAAGSQAQMERAARFTPMTGSELDSISPRETCKRAQRTRGTTPSVPPSSTTSWPTTTSLVPDPQRDARAGIKVGPRRARRGPANTVTSGSPTR